MEEAEAVRATAIIRFPDDRQIAIAHAVTATIRREWEVALMRWCGGAFSIGVVSRATSRHVCTTR